jgi:hypothetical protein
VIDEVLPQIRSESGIDLVGGDVSPMTALAEANHLDSADLVDARAGRLVRMYA